MNTTTKRRPGRPKSPNPMGTITVRITVSERARIEAAAAAARRPTSQWMRLVLVDAANAK